MGLQPAAPTEPTVKSQAELHLAELAEQPMTVVLDQEKRDRQAATPRVSVPVAVVGRTIARAPALWWVAKAFRQAEMATTAVTAPMARPGILPPPIRGHGPLDYGLDCKESQDFAVNTAPAAAAVVPAGVRNSEPVSDAEP